MFGYEFHLACDILHHQNVVDDYFDHLVLKEWFKRLDQSSLMWTDLRGYPQSSRYPFNYVNRKRWLEFNPSVRSLWFTTLTKNLATRLFSWDCNQINAGGGVFFFFLSASDQWPNQLHAQQIANCMVVKVDWGAGTAEAIAFGSSWKLCQD